MHYLEQIEDSTAASFGTGGSLLEAIETGQRFDFILLDIELPDMRGTEIVRKLRVQAPSVDVAFLTAYPHYATDAFRLKVAQFFVKPVNEETFLTEIRRLIDCRKKRSRPWIVRTKGNLYRLLPSEILYVEAYYRVLHIQTKRGQIACKGKLSDAIDALPAMYFARSHKSFLINMKFVHSVTQKDAVLASGQTVPISTRMRSEFLNALTQFATR